MGLRFLQIENFRGISFCQWNITEPLCCLVGQGDSGKTTVLDAIRLAMLPHWTCEFFDSDFGQCDTSEPITIEVTVDPPETLLSESAFGLHLRGWSKETGVTDEPLDGLIPVITIRLKVDSSFEPQWRVITERCPDGVPISARQRASLGAFLLTPYAKDVFGWGRGTLISKMTDTEEVSLSSILSLAKQELKNSMAGDVLNPLNEVAFEICTSVRSYGVLTGDAYVANIDLKNVKFSSGALSLHEGNVPLQCFGSGTRKLVNMTIFDKVYPNAGVLCIDEMESGLEPYRVRQLIDVLKRRTEGSVIMTTHSSVALRELSAHNIFVVEEGNAGRLSITNVPTNLQNIVRAAPEAFLAESVVVCEGATEVGMLRACNEYWQAKKERPSLWTIGVELVDGGGDDQVERARAFSSLGFEVICVMDSDKPDTLAKANKLKDERRVHICAWDGELSTDQVVFAYANPNSISSLLSTISSWIEVGSLKASLEADDRIANLGEDIPEWPTQCALDDLQRVCGERAKAKSWFKNISQAEEVFRCVFNNAEGYAGTDFMEKIEELEEIIHAG